MFEYPKRIKFIYYLNNTLQQLKETVTQRAVYQPPLIIPILPMKIKGKQRTRSRKLSLSACWLPNKVNYKSFKRSYYTFKAEIKNSNNNCITKEEYCITITTNAKLRFKIDDDIDVWNRRILRICFRDNKTKKIIPELANKLFN